MIEQTKYIADIYCLSKKIATLVKGKRVTNAQWDHMVARDDIDSKLFRLCFYQK